MAAAALLAPVGSTTEESMMRIAAASLILLLALSACASVTGYQPPRERSAADIQWEYGLQAGAPMRDSPKQ